MTPAALFLSFATLLAPAPDATCDPGGGEVRPSGTLAMAAETLARGRRHEDPQARRALYLHVQDAAEARIAADPDDLEARWWRVAAMGLLVDEVGARRKVELAGEIRREALTMLDQDPSHPGAHMALGRLHSGVLRLNPVLRFFALRLFGEAEVGEASWDDAERHLLRARDAVPCALIHRYELARVYAYQGRDTEALAELAAIDRLPDAAPQDPEVRELAAELEARIHAGEARAS
jgi:hypothetical protein